MAATNEKQLDQGLIVASLASECRLPIGAMATMYQCPHIFAICTVLQSLRRQDIAELIVAARQPALSGL